MSIITCAAIIGGNDEKDKGLRVEFMELFDEISPFKSGFLAVDDTHTLYYECSGNPDGIPVVWLHGGPGQGSEPKNRQQFDPEKFLIVLFDQRGCGQSTPARCLNGNDTAHLIEDINTLRQHLGIEKWLVAGSSWGSTLGLLYAQTYPEQVLGMAFRGISLAEHDHHAWLHGTAGAAKFFPDLYERYLDPLSEAERRDPLAAYYTRLQDKRQTNRYLAAENALGWEGGLCGMEYNILAKRQAAKDAGEEYEPNMDFWETLALINHHFSVHDFFIEDGQILKNADKIAHLPCALVHGRYDMVCALENAWKLHKALPKSTLTIVPDAGHSGSECKDAFLNAIHSLEISK